MLEGIGLVLGAVILVGIIGFTLALGLAMAGAAALITGYALAGLACIGWIPILICAFTTSNEIGVDGVGTLAYYAMWLYLTLSVAILIIGFTVEDPDKIPPGYKFLALFFVHPAEKLNVVESPKAYVAAVTTVPDNPIWARVEARRFDRMAKDAEAVTSHHTAAADLLKAKLEEARAEALKKAQQEDSNDKR